MRAMKPARLVVAALAAVGFAGPAGAQTQIFGMNLEGNIEAGFRGFP